MREITSHKVNGCNEALTVCAIDEKGSGGANHHYLVMLPHHVDSWKADGEGSTPIANCGSIRFQNGPIKEAGVNGLTHEVLLAIVIDRLQSFQAGPFACRENALALTKLEEAAHWLHHRTRARVARGGRGEPCITKASGIIPAGPDALAAAKAAAEAALKPERDPLEPIAWALSLAGNRPNRKDFYLNKTAAEIDARNGYEVIPLVDGRKVAVLLGKDQPEPKKQLVIKDREDVAQIYYDRPDLQPLIDATIDGVLDIFAAQFGVKTFDAGDGSEDFWGDIGGSVMNLLTEAGLDEYRGKDQPETPAEVLTASELNDALVDAEEPALRERDKERDKRIADEARREERERIADWLCNRGWTVASDYVRADAAKGAT